MRNNEVLLTLPNKMSSGSLTACLSSEFVVGRRRLLTWFSTNLRIVILAYRNKEDETGKERIHSPCPTYS